MLDFGDLKSRAVFSTMSLPLFSATQGGRAGGRRLQSGAGNAAAVLPWPTSSSASS
jgi:hypothetical protein